MKSLWVTPNESQTGGRGAAAVAAVGEEEEGEEEEHTKVIIYIFSIHLRDLFFFALQMYFQNQVYLFLSQLYK